MRLPHANGKLRGRGSSPLKDTDDRHRVERPDVGCSLQRAYMGRGLDGLRKHPLAVVGLRGRNRGRRRGLGLCETVSEQGRASVGGARIVTCRVAVLILVVRFRRGRGGERRRKARVLGGLVERRERLGVVGAADGGERARRRRARVGARGVRERIGMLAGGIGRVADRPCAIASVPRLVRARGGERAVPRLRAAHVRGAICRGRGGAEQRSRKGRGQLGLDARGRRRADRRGRGRLAVVVVRGRGADGREGDGTRVGSGGRGARREGQVGGGLAGHGGGQVVLSVGGLGQLADGALAFERSLGMGGNEAVRHLFLLALCFRAAVAKPDIDLQRGDVSL